ncbi:arsenic resistance N-acetyltransferase ArsN2 [Niveibacterium sp. 24ML]|uniref:arsinothricin resistance N-acetyltransferase ArsN1 family B n=1 Tax=Niveibacterium sp. 24ML TaxID=2985512 RepID=UPI00226F9BB0|nr:arsinothricin resistance N-acetyltransferase ArsN1 family B [Niveibacterium sp. 24ML]MCX9157533.1 arsenic resistance N-acetyltransferase ArsN2 [Niveibacterium sp. 24ML]
MNDINLAPAKADDWPAIAQLLETHRQPLAGAQAQLPNFIVAHRDGAVLGCVGLEIHGAHALLRSLSVAPAMQGYGIGTRLLRAAIERARALNMRALYLLTVSAPDYFPRFGFRRIPHAAAPLALHASPELQGACPASAILMTLPLKAAAIRIRPASLDDAAAVAAIYDPIVAHTATSFELEPPGPLEMRNRIARTLPKLPWLLAVDENDTVCGYVYASPHRERAAYQWSVDTSAYICTDARGQGVGQRLYTALFDALIELGYVQAFAGIALPNAASVGLHTSMGFTEIGVYRNVGYKMGAWHDVGWWQKCLQTPPEHPAMPARPLTAAPRANAEGAPY